MHRKLVLSKDSMVVCDVYVYNPLFIVETTKENMCYSMVNTFKIKIIYTWLAIDILMDVKENNWTVSQDGNGDLNLCTNKMELSSELTL